MTDKNTGAGTSAARGKDDGDWVAGVRISHPERVLFKPEGIRKIDLARYYEAASERFLEHAQGRPVSLLRCPQGDIAHCFFQKHASDGFPEAIGQVPIRESDGGTENYMVIRDVEGLVAAVQVGTMEFHIWGSTAAELENPTRMVFDLDPDAGLDFADVRKAAVDLRGVLDAVGLKSLAMVTGGKGVHIVVPLDGRAEWSTVKDFAKALAVRLADAAPDRYIATMSKAKRKDRIFIDWLRNERGATAVAPYSVRARKGGPVAVPISWDELKTLKAANGFAINEALERLGGPDPWREAGTWRQSVTKAMVEAVGAS
ncbi:non-homologous end-joining DNA ligase [Rhizobium alarense]|uniref:non-homologous end-joining DNA ligase n=1 Tax=Rhizobium alarense TaxID=2846851 RepID=UPI0038B56889